jgi:hypothetical protein
MDPPGRPSFCAEKRLFIIPENMQRPFSQVLPAGYKPNDRLI